VAHAEEVARLERENAALREALNTVHATAASYGNDTEAILKEIIRVAEAALGTKLNARGDSLDDLFDTVAGVPCRFCLGPGSDTGRCPDCDKPKPSLQRGTSK
jgi:uncharacterized protein (UPF0335 family)